MHWLTQSALLRALGWSLFNSLWQMSLLWVAYHLFVAIFRDATAKTRHGLAALLLSIGAGWAACTFIVTYWFSPPAATSLLPASIEAYGRRLSFVGRWFVDEGLSWCSSFYLLILCGLLVHYTNHFLRSRRITREGLSKMPPGFRVFVAATARNMGILPAVRVYLSSLVDVPVTLDFLKPVILLPVAMITQLTPHQVEAILVHELAHIRRGDYLINLGVTVIELLFFFNPFARMLIGRLKNEREHCCDDLVLQFRYEPHAYVSALLSLARQHRQGRLAVAAIGGGGSRLLLQRARKILQQKRVNERPGSLPLFLFVSMISLTVLLAGVNRSSQPTPGPQTVIKAFHPPVVTDGYQPHPALAANRRSIPAHRPHREQPAKHPATILLDGNGLTLLNTAGPASAPAPIYADRIVLENRDYSIGESQPDGKLPQTGDGESYPFIPQSSFSFQYTDTLPPEDKLAMMQQVTEKTIRLRIGQLKSEWKARLDRLQQYETSLNRAMAKENHTVAVTRKAPSDGDRRAPSDCARKAPSYSDQALQQIRRQHQELQRQYLKKLEDLQHQLQRANHLLTTVYI